MGQRDLAELQRFITSALQRPTPLGAELAPAVDALVVPSARGITPTQRLEIYRDQFWQRHLRNLADDYPTLAWAIGGAGPFAELAREFLLASPPKTWDLQRLGAGLPGFVSRHPRFATAAQVCDAAALDWAFMAIFDAPDGEPFDPRVLASTPEDAWPSARIVLHPALRLVALRSDVLAVREALEQGASVPEAQVSPGDASLAGEASKAGQVGQAGQVGAIVWRDAACYPRSLRLDPAAFALLARLDNEEPLGVACEAVAAEHAASGDVGARVGAWFQDWVQRGWVCRVVVQPAFAS